MYSLLGNVSSPRYDLETTREHTAIVFQRFDKLHQGYITIQDFMSFCLNVKKTKEIKRRTIVYLFFLLIFRIRP